MQGSSLAFEKRQPAPWDRAGGLENVIAKWFDSNEFLPNIVLSHELSAVPPVEKAMPESLGPGLRSALTGRGLKSLYLHQAQAFALASEGHDVVVATPTASGKSLCYNLPVLDALEKTRDTRALYLFPTKALARDQEVSLRALLSEACIDAGAITYDGDTPPDVRRAARDRSGVLITNPDMLHTGILPHHASWARFFSNLRFIVVDEVHSYRGVFGSHLANVLRRMLRIARFHGAAPQVLFASATIGNPKQHAEALLGRPVTLVEENGAPRGSRRVVFYNPPVVNRELGLRASTVKTTVRLATDLLKAGVSTLVFGQSRNQVEVMLKYLRENLARERIDPELVQGYRGGYLPDLRRKIERGLRDGMVRGVVATNALELGVDIGALDAVVSAGYPGSMAALWQRFGRAGRRRGPSMAVLVANSSPLDQYLAREPELLVQAPVEEARIDPDNVEIFIQHLKCAAFELPFELGEGFGTVPDGQVGEALEFLRAHRVLHPSGGLGKKTVYHWASDAYPANAVSLRSASWDNFAIIDVAVSKTIAEMDFRSTHTMLHEQAIYQHDGAQYQVERLDYENHKAFVRKVEPDYYTTAMTHAKVNVLAEDRKLPMHLGGLAPLSVGLGDVNVVEKVVGFKKIKFHTHENIGYGEVQLPEIQKPTTAFWISVPLSIVDAVGAPRAVVMDALSGLAQAMHGVAAVGLMMDPRDIGWTLVDGSEHGEAPRPSDGGAFEPTIFLYDSVAGGVGLAPRLFEERESLLIRARSLLSACPCKEGCPSCAGPVAPQATPWSRKGLALDVLSAIGVGRNH